MKDLLFGAYLAPANNSIKLALSVKNRVMQDTFHLHATVYAMKQSLSEKEAGNIILDVGCFDGGTTIYFRNEFPGKKIIGFEAGKQTYQRAKENTQNISGITIENHAVSDFCGITEFFVTDNKVSSSLNPLTGADARFYTDHVEKVETITLDEYFTRQNMNDKKVLLMKLDVQGHELKVLKGAAGILSNTQFVLTEMSNHKSYEGGAQYHEVDKVLRENGFVLHNLFSSYSYDPYLYEFDALYIKKGLIR